MLCSKSWAFCFGQVMYASVTGYGGSSIYDPFSIAGPTADTHDHLIERLSNLSLAPPALPSPCTHTCNLDAVLSSYRHFGKLRSAYVSKAACTMARHADIC